MIKVLIADDQEMIRESIKIVLSSYPDIDVVGSVADGSQVLNFLKHTVVDIILMDIRMPIMDGVVATKKVKEEFPDVKVIILTTFDDDEFYFQCIGIRCIRLHFERYFDGRTPSSNFDFMVNSGNAMLNPDICSKGISVIFTNHS